MTCGLTLCRVPQYKSRFKKWDLPSLRTIPSQEAAESPLPNPTGDLCSDGPLLAVFTADSATEGVTDSWAVPNPDTRSNLAMECEIGQQADAGSPANCFFAIESLSTETGPEKSVDESLFFSGQTGALSDQRDCLHVQSDVVTMNVEGIAPRELLNAMRRYDVMAVLSAQDLRCITNSAHFLFAAGSYKDAHDLYVTVWQVLLARKTSTFVSLVHSVVNVARSSHDSVQLTNAKTAIERVMSHAGERVNRFSTATSTLHAHLADILRKLDRPSEAVVHCDYALSSFEGLADDSGCVPEDRRWGILLLCQCRMQVAMQRNDRSCSLQRPWVRNRMECWETEKSHDRTLQLIVKWCAARLVENELHIKLSEASQAIQSFMRDYKEVVRELSRVTFCHLWASYVKASQLENDKGISTLVENVLELTGMSAPELFASVSLMLFKLARTHSSDLFSQTNFTAQLLKHAQVDALNLASTHGSHSDFMKRLLAAYAVINTAHVPSPTLGLQCFSSFIEEHSKISFSGDIPDAPDGPSDSALRRPSFDPTLTSTPRSSMSSGLASMMSSKRAIARRTDRSLIDDALASSSNPSLRRQQHFSITSSRTSSTRGSSLYRESAMEWEPTTGTDDQGAAASHAPA
jgi:hypothetical protein